MSIAIGSRLGHYDLTALIGEGSATDRRESMLRVGTQGTVLAVLVVGLLAGTVGVPMAQTVVEQSAEARFQLDLQVPDAAVREFLPPGWTLNVSTRGAATDANLRAIFIDRLTINDPDGAPIGQTGSNRLVYLTVPVTNPCGRERSTRDRRFDGRPRGRARPFRCVSADDHA